MDGNNVANSDSKVDIAKDAKKKTSAERMVSYKDWARFNTILYPIDYLEKVPSKQDWGAEKNRKRETCRQQVWKEREAVWGEKGRH